MEVIQITEQMCPTTATKNTNLIKYMNRWAERKYNGKIWTKHLPN